VADETEESESLSVDGELDLEAMRISEELYRRIIDAAAEGIWLIDAIGITTFVNPAVTRLLGYPVAEIIGQPLQDFIDGGAQTDTGRPADWRGRHECRFRCKDGSELWAALTGTSADGDGALLVLMTDITGRKQAERLENALNAIQRAIDSALPTEEVIQQVLAESTRALDCESAGIILRRGTGWQVAHVYGMPAAIVGRTFTKAGMLHAEQAVATGDVVAVGDLMAEAGNFPTDVRAYHVLSLLVAPLTVRGETVGVVFFNHERQAMAFPPTQLDFARKLSVAISLTLANAQLYTVESRQPVELEQRVAERTAELLERQAALRAEIAERRHAEEALAQQAALLREQADLLNLSQDAIIARDMDARIRFWNRGAAERYGWSASEVIGQRSHTLFQTVFPYPVEQVYADLLAHDHWEGELQHTLRNGERIVVACRWALQRDAAGQPIGVLEINNDITHQKEAQAQIAYQAHLLANVSDAVMATDKDGIITAWNHAAEALFRVPSAEALGKPTHDVFQVEYVTPDEQEAIAMLVGSGRYRGEVIYHRRDGSPFTAETTGMALHDETGATTGYIGVTRDISEQKRTQQELSLQAKRLQIVHNIDRAVLAAASPAEIAAAAVRHVRQLVPCDRASVVLFDFERGEAERLAVDSAVPTKHDTGSRSPLSAYEVTEKHWEARALAVPDLEKQPQRTPITEDLLSEGLHAMISVPLVMEGKLIGQLNLAARQPQTFSAQHLHAARQVGDSLAVAVQHARLYEAERLARETSETLRTANLRLTQSLDLPTVLNTLLDSLARLAPYDYAQVLLIAEESCLTLAAARTPGHTNEHTIAGSAAVLDVRTHPVLAQLLGEQRCILVPDTAVQTAWEPLPGMQNARSWLGAPLVTAGKTIGLCVLGQAEPGRFTGEQVRLAEAIAAQAATAIQNAQLFAQVEQGRQRQQALAHRLVEAQESERRAIARELHDEAGQSLTSLMIGLGLLEHDAGHSEAVITRARELKQTADGVLEGLHRLSVNLRPATLDRLGLVPALRQYAEVCRRQNALDVDMMVVGLAEDERLAPELETTVYRVVQESLTNVVRHAHAQHVAIILEREVDRVTAIVEDDGVGFDPEEALRRGRLGLFGMQERAEMFGGRFTVESSPTQGTTVFLELPLKNDA
jgi:PAS domain S-box-containing protein